MATHLDRICALVDARIDGKPRVLLDERVAVQLGVVELIESCRNEHLASLDADDGLAVLGIAWEDVVARLRQTAESRRRCRHCSGRMRGSRGGPHRCGDCGRVCR